MRYRFVKPDEVRADYRKQDALSADIQAFAAEIDADTEEASGRQEATEDDTDSVARARAKDLRAEAKKRLKAENVSDHEVRVARTNWLRQWIEGMEREHAGHLTQKELKEARSEDTNTHVLAIEMIERIHGRALVELDLLTSPEEEPPPNRAARRTVKRASTSK